MDRKLLFSKDRFLASIIIVETTRSSADQGNSLFAFVFVCAFKVVNGNKLPQRVSDTAHTEDVDAKVKDAVQCVTVVTTLPTGDARSQPTSENLVYPSCLSELGIEFPKVPSLSYQYLRKGGWNTRWLSIKAGFL